jgi:hypothetical protein
MRVEVHVLVQKEDGSTKTGRLFTDVPVLRVDAGPGEDDTKPAPKVTLDNLSPEACQKLALAAALGKLFVKPCPAADR